MDRPRAVTLAAMLVSGVALGGAIALAVGRGAGADAAVRQIAAGREAYVRECVRCHLPGGIGPTLVRDALAAYRTPQLLFNYVRLAMPYDAPQSLDDDTYWAVTAYVLDSLRLWPAERPLDPAGAMQPLAR